LARIRTIKPEMWTDPAFVECSSNARLLFVAALNFASDYGVIDDSASRLKMQCFPADNFDVKPLIDELVAARLWDRMVAPDGENVLVIRTFCAHQRVDRPQKGRWGDWREWPKIVEPSSNVLRMNVDRSPCNGREGSKDLVKPKLDHASDFATFWAAYPRKQAKKAAEKAYVKARRAATADEIIGALGPLKQQHSDPRTRQYVPHAASWLNGERWKDEAPPSSNGLRTRYDEATGAMLLEGLVPN
jgi:hypothetical protein